MSALTAIAAPQRSRYSACALISRSLRAMAAITAGAEQGDRLHDLEQLGTPADHFGDHPAGEVEHDEVEAALIRLGRRRQIVQSRAAGASPHRLHLDRGACHALDLGPHECQRQVGHRPGSIRLDEDDVLVVQRGGILRMSGSRSAADPEETEKEERRSAEPAATNSCGHVRFLSSVQEKGSDQATPRSGEISS